MSNPWIRKEIIGDCTLYLGDCLDVIPTLGVVDHVVADPAYEATLHKAKNSSKKTMRTDGGSESKALNFASIDDIRDSFIEAISKTSARWVLLFCTVEGTTMWANAINPSSIKYKRACIWVKPDATPQMNGQGPAQGAECFVSAWAGTGYAKWNAGGKRGVYTHYINPSDRDGRHPTEKPWRLINEMLKDFTNPGDIILDPFMGSGTTGVSCVKTGRKFIGIEIDETSFEIACERIQKANDQPSLFVPPPHVRAKQEVLL